MHTGSELRRVFRMNDSPQRSKIVRPVSVPSRRGRDENEFTEQTRRDLAERVRHRCGFPGCRTVTVGPKKGSTKAAKSGWAAHIRGAAPGSARHSARMTPAQRRSPDNGIHMCAHHGMLVDADGKKYPVHLVRKWKREAEARARHEHELGIVLTRAPSAPSARLTCVGTRTTRLFDKPGGAYEFTVS